ncbi:MAG: hypothetical protein ACNS64_14765 [Candidatus Halalkalibacterium sp. M3_1C_030]
MHYLFLVAIILCFLSAPLKAQVVIGDIIVQSWQEMFDPNNSELWSKKANNISYELNDGASKFWTTNQFSGFVPNLDNNYPSTISLIVKPNLDLDAFSTTLTEEFDKQFGDHKKVKIDHPIVIGATEKLSMIRWMHTHKEQMYELTFGQVETYRMLIVKKSELSE